MSVELHTYLVDQFRSWQPSAPQVVSRNKGDITLDWRQREPFGFLRDQLLYKVEKNDKIPKWVVVYSGGKEIKKIDYLAPRHPHRFRLKVILKAPAVPQLADMALKHYGDENTVYEKMRQTDEESDEFNDQMNLEPSINVKNDTQKHDDQIDCGDVNSEDSKDDIENENQNAKLDFKKVCNAVKIVNSLKKNADDAGDKNNRSEGQKWIESQWSEETWTNTDTDGTSPVCFCMAVKYGYHKQIQVMLEERPDLLGIVNSTNGFTPLATAVRKGDINTVRFLVSLGAEVDQPSLAGQTPLHLAVLVGNLAIVELLLEKGADFEARDWNGLRVEHYAVDSCDLATLQFILDRGGDLAARDRNGWTPLFRALCQGAKTVIVEELVARGNNVDAVDHAGLPLMSAAKLLKNRHGRPRDSVVRLVDRNYPHEKALANFTRLTKKIYNVHTLLKMN